MKRMICSILAVLMSLSLFACGQKPSTGTSADSLTWQEQYDLGVRYLSEGNYEEAILAFTAAIKIDPKRPEGYLALADAYTGAGDTDSAKKVLEDGFDATGSEDIQALLDDLSGDKDSSLQNDSIRVPMDFEVVESRGVQLENIEVTFEGWGDYGGIMISASVSGDPVYYAFNMCSGESHFPENMDLLPLTADEMERMQQWGEPNTIPNQEMCVFPNTSPYNIYQLWDSAGNHVGAGCILVYRSAEAEAWIDTHPGAYFSYYE